MTTQQKLYIRLVKRPMGFLGALVASVLLSPLFIATMRLLFFTTIKKVLGREDINSSEVGVATMEAFNGKN